ncbi:MAG: aspartate-semialdehyde dehydrogenase [Gammaproteobacteria bacterium]|nr:aspartate-semialdehyde dehydrogenase [Gammaproteobacteria bacterium]
MTKTYDVAIVGATGVVGEVFFDVLEQRGFPVGKLYPLASERSVGEKLEFNGKPLMVADVAHFDFSRCQFAFFSAGSEVSKKYVPIAASAGCTVIDNTSEFRYQKDIPLVVPEVNPEAIWQHKDTKIIANPNCSTAQLVVVLKPLYDAVGITRVNVATYQAVSGAGRKAIEELARQTAGLLGGEEVDSEVFNKQIAFNCIPHIDEFQENGYTREEMKMVWETQKIFNDSHLQVNPTAVRVPVFYGHSEAVHIELKQPMRIDEVKALLKKSPGILLIEDDADYPTAITHAASQDAVFVGRIRRDISHPSGINLWVVADNVRKGAALNAVQIAELIINRNGALH